MAFGIISRLIGLSRKIAAAGILWVTALPGVASADDARVKEVPGQPNLLIGGIDLAALGYEIHEFFLPGTATSYRAEGGMTADGNWQAVADKKAKFKTRIVVIRPSSAETFNGTLLVEWLNVTSGQDTPADWMLTHREILRSGHAYAAVSAQIVGVEGGQSIMGQGTPLKKANPERYGSLSHPGDAFSFDIFTQAGRAAEKAGLGSLKAERVIAMGESQSAAYLTTYVNAVDPLAQFYDGFFVHSRFGSGASLTGTRSGEGPDKVPDFVSFREDLRVPVLSLITETDLMGSRLPGYLNARRPDDDLLRVWEVAGTAHADSYLFMGAFLDNGSASMEKLARIYAPSLDGPMGKLKEPINPGQPHHYTTQAAISSLDAWLRTSTPPPVTPVLETRCICGDGPAEFVVDSNGIARGGVRTPWVDVPTARMSGQGDPSSFIGMLAGSAAPFDEATLARLYPGGKDDYLAKFEKALDRAIANGHVLAADKGEIMAIAAINYGKGV